MRSSFYDKMSFTERERERKSTPVQCLGFKRKKKGKKTNLFNTVFWGEREYEYNTRR